MDRRSAYGPAIVLLVLLTMFPYAPSQPLASAWVAVTWSGVEPPESYSHAAWNAATGEFLFAQAYGECHIREGRGGLLGMGIGVGRDFVGTAEAGLNVVERERDSFLSEYCREESKYANIYVSAKAQNFPQFAGSMRDIERPVAALPARGLTEYSVSVVGEDVRIRIASGTGYPEDCRSFFGLLGLEPKHFGSWGSVYRAGAPNHEPNKGFLLCVHVEFEDHPDLQLPLQSEMTSGPIPRLAA